jgi:hypothetical protein
MGTKVPSSNYSRYKSPIPNIPITHLNNDHTKMMMAIKHPDDSHVLDENLETTTAKAIRTPHLHFSQIRCRHVAAHPAPVLSSGLGLGADLFVIVVGVRRVAAFEDDDDDDDGEEVGSGVGCRTGSLGFPFSLSPMFGKSRSSGEEY